MVKHIFILLFTSLVCLQFTNLANAQLANTSWPTVYHDMKRSNRTNAIGLQTQPQATKWRINLPQRFGGGSLRGVTIGKNGKYLYLAGGFNGVYALDKTQIINNSPKIIWQRFAEQGVGNSACSPILADNEKWIDMPPTIGEDGTLLITTEYGWGMALDPNNGNYSLNGDSGLKYKFYLCKTEQAVAVYGSTMYAGSWDGKFFAYTLGDGFSGSTTDPKNQSDSRIKWTYQFANKGRLYTYGTPAIDDDGTIYFGFKGIYAFYPDSKCLDPKAHCAAQLKWKVDDPSPLETAGGALPFQGVTIGNNGYIFLLHDNYLLGVHKITKTSWKVNTGGKVRGRHPAVAADGTVYFGSDDGYLYAINPNGTNDIERIKWKFRLGLCQAFSNTLVDGSSTIYINTNCDTNGNGRLYAVNANGTEKWRFNSGVKQSFLHDQQMSMDYDGTLFFNTGQNEFAAISGNGITPTKVQTLPGNVVPPDNVVDILDYDAVVSDFGQQGANLGSDISLPLGSVDIFDYNKVVSNFGRTN